MEPIEITLGEALRLAAEGRFPEGWLFLPSRAVTLATPALVVEYGADADARSIPFVATARGFPIEGLDKDLLEDVVEGARGLQDPPDDDLLLEAFVYYWVYDAFLPARGAPAPTGGGL